MSSWIWRTLAQWRQKRRARLVFFEISRCQNGHLLDDIGLDRMDAGSNLPDRAGRHRFWML
jgi:uncharacterized protein YjiS (DUF1127 family)